MVAIEAVQAAKEFIQQVFEGEEIVHMGLEELEFRDKDSVVASADAVDHASFPRLGLTDAGLLGLMSRDTPLVMVDLDLYLAASATDPSSAVNYRHLQERYVQST